MNMRNYTGGFDFPIKDIKELRQKVTGNLSTLEAVFDLSSTPVTYITGSNFAFYVPNSQKDVEKFAKLFNLDLDFRFILERNGAYTGRPSKQPVPIADKLAGISVRELLTNYIDLTGIISKKQLASFVPYCKDADEKAKLEKVSSRSDEGLYDECLLSKQRGMIDILEVFPSL